MVANRKPLHRYTAPSTWPTWLGLGLLRMVCWLPHPLALAIGRGLGRLAHLAGGERLAIVRRNIHLCFPDLTAEQRDDLARRHFAALGISVIEMGLGRWASDERLLALTTIEGVDHVLHAVNSGKGVILLSAHFTTLEVSGRVLSLNIPPFDAVYRKSRSVFATEVLRTGRERSAARTIEKRDIKSMVRTLRAGGIVWYAPDQSYNRKGAEVIPFFGVPSMHTTATSTLARLGKAVTIPYFPERTADGRYHLTILPPLEDFPGDDLIEDTNKYVRVLEEQVRRCPEQYLWVHRKFKDLPDSYPDYYADLDALK
ncbi:MAG: lipid A biosynthesis lauroyl acyltransferase [Gammaproteobacteria bacterium]|jgi:KDO2-lipid IV(A) lauroyltransferase|nr:lipid A biosynthesis lauroyl acyltransferase [Gammaproteobacteria bacterium]MDH3749730.1 lipid A biosynthesis lauroyl acyltransferase [Gammaproteobacteria bacterium]MDH3804453.1 lipid A biosynthesis lauroyl acyltransferase [Gammaproteobacteria bacterium]